MVLIYYRTAGQWWHAYHRYRPPTGRRTFFCQSLSPISHLFPTTSASAFHIPNLPQSISSDPLRRATASDLPHSPGDCAARASSTLDTIPTSSKSMASMQAPTPRTRTYSYSQSRRQSLHAVGSATTLHLHWLFRSNIPRRRGMPLPADINKRNFFGIGEILGVLANPSETLRSLSESKRMLEEARRELAEARERAQLSPTHTFSSLPGFYDRPAELRAIERALEGDHSVGKTALLRQVLTRSKYHVLHFDLRIAGFADLASLYMSLSQQMEAFFMAIAQDPDMPGYSEFEKEAWGFKHDRLSVERRMANSPQPGDNTGHCALGEIKTSDVARLMELFQSSLLRYWNFQPSSSGHSRKPSTSTTADTDNASQRTSAFDAPSKNGKKTWRMRFFGGRKKPAEKRNSSQTKRETMNGDGHGPESEKGKEPGLPPKKIPVFFIDEAHKLAALIRSTDAMKCLLDAMLVLTKQDRLCHVIHATSDPFYQTWLRQLNVMQHCKIITIGDYPKSDTRRFFRERILPNVPEPLRPGLEFGRLYEAFGGKLAHWQDYIADYSMFSVYLSIASSDTHLGSHALLNLHIIHSAQPRDLAPPTPNSIHDGSQHATQRLSPPPGSNTAFRIYSPLTAHPHILPPGFGGASGSAGSAPEFQTDFTALQLLKVMNQLAQPGARSLPYFLLCREIGVRTVDAMVRGRILDLRWTEPITREWTDARVLSMRLRDSVRVRDSLRVRESVRIRDSVRVRLAREGGMEALTEDEVLRAHERLMEAQAAEDDEEEMVGPKLVPITPIMRFAMREVVQEYYDDDDQTVSEYASLSDVEEY
ncbi:hypothetical protein B0H21DRAFT_751367 [Amylocystis lapponica]|nr:hypothetical protein B0H21DRAFT_751367 [Amylocystis lapponica]